jgi:hypothetical protein
VFYIIAVDNCQKSISLTFCKIQKQHKYNSAVARNKDFFKEENQKEGKFPKKNLFFKKKEAISSSRKTKQEHFKKSAQKASYDIMQPK